MATIKQVMEVIDKLKASKPIEFFKGIDEINSGMRFIMMYLDAVNNDVYASELSEKMNISRARIAILIKKLIAKDFVVKIKSGSDARKDIIKLTEKGKSEINKEKERVFNNIAKVIDSLGIKKVNQFIELSTKIRNILKKC